MTAIVVMRVTAYKAKSIYNMKASVIGATGAAGKDLVNVLLKDPDYTEVVIFVRRPAGIIHPKLMEVITDFDRLGDVSGSTTVCNLAPLYRDGDVFYKRQIVSALFPQNLEYDGYGFRTAHFNEVVATIFSLDAISPK